MHMPFLILALLFTTAALATGIHVIALAACVAWGLHWYGLFEAMGLKGRRHLAAPVVLFEGLGLTLLLGSQVHPVFLWNASAAAVMAVALWNLREWRVGSANA